MRRAALATLTIFIAGVTIASGGSLNSYDQTNLTSDLPGVAANQDTDLVNPWGIVAGPKTPFWVSDNGKGLSTLYTGSGTKLGLVVTVPGPGGATGDPTGIVFNSTPSNFGGSHFIFATESGTIDGWAGGSNASIAASGAAGSVYKGLAIGNDHLYAANFGLGRIDVFDSSFSPTTLAGSFSDPTLPSGYAPFNVQAIGSQLYVTFAKTSGGKDELHGAGLGFVDAFDMNGNFVKRIGTQGALNAPWGVALAPSQFGAFSNDLLIGNFGSGEIDAFDPNTSTFLGTLDDSKGNPITIEGLWGLSFGNGSVGQNVDSLYFTAGIPGTGEVEDHGLFGSLSASTPEPSAMLLTLVGLSCVLGLAVNFSKRKRA
jgi:uncharacterized protein (TIGR03118 family)